MFSPNRAGASVVLHRTSARQQKWDEIKSTNPLLRKVAELRQTYDESENPVVSNLRSVTETIGSWFDENETAQVIRMMKSLDPDFNQGDFERELREYIVPEVVDAYLSADQESLKAWCGEAVRFDSTCTYLALLKEFYRLIMCFGPLWRYSWLVVWLATVEC